MLRRGQAPEAAALLALAVRSRPEHAGLCCMYAFALMNCGKPADALAHACRAAALAPEMPEARHLHGILLVQAGRPAEALKEARAAAALRPGWADALCNAGVAAALVGDREAAADHFERALSAAPDHVQALVGYGRLLRDLGRVDRAVPLLRRACQAAPGFYGAWENLAPALNYLDGHDPAEVLAAHRRVADLVSADVRGRPAPTYSQSFDPERPLRVGVLSGDLRSHSVAMFLLPILEHHNRSLCSVHLYSNTRSTDAATQRLRGLAASWRDVTALDDRAVADAVRGDAIDVLIDLGGHTATSRWPVLRYRPAPVQATYLGYPATTGLAAAQWRIIDPITDPPGAESACVERLAELKPCFLCFAPPDRLDPSLAVPEVGPLPAAESGFVTFCSFNNITKIGPGVARVWGRVLDRAPGSRLLLKGIGVHDDFTGRTFLSALAEAGVDVSRVDLVAYEPTRAGHLALYNRADIALDTFPYNGTATTCEALLMGVPVVTVEGRTHVARVGASLLSAAGLPELVARDADGLVDMAARLAGDLPALASRRAGLRGRLLASALCDGAGFAGRFVALLRAMWRERCAARAGP